MLPFDPKKPLFGFTAKFPHAKRRIHVFADDQFVYFRPKNAPEDWLCALIRQYWMKTHAGLARDTLNSDFCWRVFYLADPRYMETRLWRIFWRPDYGYVVPAEHPRGLEGAFFWPQSFEHIVDMFKTSTDNFQQHFERQWLDPQSDVRCALSWCDLNTEQRNRQAINWNCGSYEELESVSLLAFKFETEWTEEAPSSVYFEASQPSETLPYEDIIYRFIEHYRVCYSFPNPRCRRLPQTHRLSKLINRLHQRNEGVFDFPNGNRADWEKGLSWISTPPNQSRYRSVRIEGNFTHPTQHERLEAALFLRDWLRQNAPDLLPDWFPGAT